MSNFNSGSFGSSSMFFNQRDLFSGSTTYHGDGWATTTGPAGSSGLDRSIRHYTGFERSAPDWSNFDALNSHRSDPNRFSGLFTVRYFDNDQTNTNPLKGKNFSWTLPKNKAFFTYLPDEKNMLSTFITDIYDKINDIDNKYKNINKDKSFDTINTLKLIEKSLSVLNESLNKNTNLANVNKDKVRDLKDNVSTLKSFIACKNNLLGDINNKERVRKEKLNRMADILFMDYDLKYLDSSSDNYNPEMFQITYQREAKYYDYRQNEFQRMWDELMVYPAKALYEAKNAYIYTMNKIDELGNTIDDAIHDGQSDWLPPVIKQPLFAIRHPIAAWEIGTPSKNGTNISSTASNFADAGGAAIGRLEEPKYMENRGSQVNAFRHTSWQASIAAKYGEKIARRVGDAHEFNPLADLSIRQTETLKDADLIIDLLNNKIGRKLGVESNTTSMNELALITLKYYYTDGLYIAVENDSGGYDIIKEKLSHEKYQYMKSTFENLDENGNPFK